MNSKSFELMLKMGVKYVDCYSVDNALVRILLLLNLNKSFRFLLILKWIYILS